MTGKLLVRGMLAGLVAALFSFGFLKVAGEPSVERAIAFEKAMDGVKAKAKADKAAAKGLAAPAEEQEPELVSRSLQGGAGLLTGVAVFGAALGGLFALAFALVYLRIGDFTPRATSALLALLGFVSVYLTPILKYPANPPAVGLADTIGMRTSLYFSMLLISLGAMIAAGLLRSPLSKRFGGWNATLIAAGAYIAAVVGVASALPDVSEVPEGFPAPLLWDFRIASLGAQAIAWAVLGLLFGVLAERLVREGKPVFRQALA
jgi:predicted cobalt transporter CbtA